MRIVDLDFMRPSETRKIVGPFSGLVSRQIPSCQRIAAPTNICGLEVPLAYAPDFYIPENIIGFTGVLNRNPTVYFLSKTHYGHITQVHDMRSNIGRDDIGSNRLYTFGNVSGQLEEKDPGAPMTHTSRSPMTLVSSGSIPPELTHAIMVHSERKAYTPHGPKERWNKDNIPRYYHPGQQPTDKQRADAADNCPTLDFWWTFTGAKHIPHESRLYEITQEIMGT
jgi:hypothetical protein